MKKRPDIALRVRGIALCLLALSAFTAINRPANADESFTKKTTPGREVLIRGFAEFDANCQLRNVQTITVVELPAHGRVEQRSGTVTIGDNWVGNKSCVGAKLEGVQVFYVPNGGFAGRDHFTMDVRYASHRIVHANVDIFVDGAASGETKKAPVEARRVVLALNR